MLCFHPSAAHAQSVSCTHSLTHSSADTVDACETRCTHTHTHTHTHTRTLSPWSLLGPATPRRRKGDLLMAALDCECRVVGPSSEPLATPQRLPGDPTFLHSGPRSHSFGTYGLWTPSGSGCSSPSPADLHPGCLAVHRRFRDAPIFHTTQPHTVLHSNHQHPAPSTSSSHSHHLAASQMCFSVLPSNSSLLPAGPQDRTLLRFQVPCCA